MTFSENHKSSEIHKWKRKLKPGDLISLPFNCSIGDYTEVTCMVTYANRSKVTVWALKPIYSGMKVDFEEHFSFRLGCGFWDMMKLIQLK